MNQQLKNHLSNYTGGSTIEDCGKDLPIKERTVIETMLLTSDRLEVVERKLDMIHTLLFGAEPSTADNCGRQPEANVKSQAARAFTSSNTLERMCDEIYSRLTFE